MAALRLNRSSARHRVPRSGARHAGPAAPPNGLLGGLVGGLMMALFAGLAGLAVLIGPAEPAAAHAAVVSTVPQQRSVLGYSPTEVTVTFSEPVALLPGRAQVLAPDGKRINAGEASVQGATLRIPIRVADRPLGTYLVSYRVVSADSHPVAGSWTFSVGAASAGPPEPADVGVQPVVRVAVPVSRYLGYAGLVLAIGPTLLLTRLWPRRLSRRGVSRLVRAGLVLLALGTLTGLWVQAPYTSGAGLFDVSATELAQVLNSDFGLATTARLGILLLVAILLAPVLRAGTRLRPSTPGGPTDTSPPQPTTPGGPTDTSPRPTTPGGPSARPSIPSGRGVGRWRGLLLLLLTLAGLATWPLAGHAAAAPVPLASGLANVVHLAAMSVWLGGLVAFCGSLLPAAHPRVLGVILPVWSRWATLAVLWLVIGGGVLAVVEVGAVGQLTGTDYGRLLLVKLGLLTLLLVAAGFARRAVRRWGGGPSAIGSPTAMRRVVAVEVALGLVVLGVSAVLVQTTPARNAGIEAAVAASDGFAQTLDSPLYTLQFDIYPVQLGDANTVHAYVYTPDGTPLPVVEWTVSTALPARGIEPTETPMLGISPHHAVGALSFPVPGDWELRFTVRLSEVDQATVRTVVPVR